MLPAEPPIWVLFPKIPFVPEPEVQILYTTAPPEVTFKFGRYSELFEIYQLPSASPILSPWIVIPPISPVEKWTLPLKLIFHWLV